MTNARVEAVKSTKSVADERMDISQITKRVGGATYQKGISYFNQGRAIFNGMNGNVAVFL